MQTGYISENFKLYCSFENKGQKMLLNFSFSSKDYKRFNRMVCFLKRILKIAQEKK